MASRGTVPAIGVVVERIERLQPFDKVCADLVERGAGAFEQILEAQEFAPAGVAKA